MQPACRQISARTLLTGLQLWCVCTPMHTTGVQLSRGSQDEQLLAAAQAGLGLGKQQQSLQTCDSLC